jgi:crotonobetainyl-CoA:carnitine CoA-transferase CaiB-like acyl-CoA transferase
MKGLLVLDLSRYVSGPYCTMMLADAGATVIKVETPQGEDTRHLDPFVAAPDASSVSAYFLRMNRGKRSIALDLKRPEALAAFERLVSRADVLIENFRPGVMDRLGLGWSRLEELNPRLVYCSISGFGHTESPARDRSAYNVVAEYEAGVFVRRDPDENPGPLGPPVGDMFPSLHALSGILMALYRRSSTGRGGRVDIAMYDSMLSLNELRSSYAVLYGNDWNPYAHPFYSPYGVFPVRDGHICIDVTTDGQWRGFCDAIRHPEIYRMPGLSSGPERVRRYDEVIRGPWLAWLAGQGRDSAVATLAAHGVPTAAIREPGEALTSGQAAARSMMTQVGDGAGASVTTAGNPIRIDHQDSPVATTGIAPALGQDTVTVLRDTAGLSQSEVDQLLEHGAAGVSSPVSPSAV